MERSKDLCSCAVLTVLLKAAGRRGSSAGRARAGREVKEADTQGLSAWGGCRVFLLGGQRCVLGKSCRAKVKEQKPGICRWKQGGAGCSTGCGEVLQGPSWRGGRVGGWRMLLPKPNTSGLYHDN